MLGCTARAVSGALGLGANKSPFSALPHFWQRRAERLGSNPSLSRPHSAFRPVMDVDAESVAMVDGPTELPRGEDGMPLRREATM